MRCKEVDKQPTGTLSRQTTSRHILLLDDEKPVLDALSRLLRARGHQCSTALSGEMLLEVLEHGSQNGVRYDLAILDIKIVGGMGGIETMQEIKQLDIGLPMLSMSGNPVDTLFHDNESCGFVGHLEKPFSAEHLTAEIERVCTTPMPTAVS